ncbi:3-oxoacyl-[acyl-carrier-protein] synthase-3 [Gracilibacillus orientalis]|uniref:3-oxoacyl-[acyl-carrier-protein] synthase-3 n=1 Tax=Gracilibacillus orientalis TaxID=334253 RepID=A0A1I4IWR7_9BACI|nr:3-oxoacyl-[acyl-carrier-protein] synthase III C-terminal domain-containing protein [Gracilibacillus orientalis]SFL58477.1 3-oxoacyl-[acyl-carrier-protein] synthase-3 [Gracilibacillus orientalis]
MSNIKIKKVATYHPTNLVTNEPYIEHFKQKGRDITSFLEKMGKEKRYIINNREENSLTMAMEASKNVLEKSSLTGEDIDYIVFSSQVPEYTFPSNTMFVHKAIDANRHAISLDTNANCAGMVVSIEQTCRYMMGNPTINRALVVGSDHLSLLANPEEEITYATYGDAACAVILERTEEQTGFIDAVYTIDTQNVDKIMFPEKGLKHFHQQIPEQKYINFAPFDASYGPEIMIEQIEHILEKNQLTISDISAVCISQFALSDKLKLQGHFKLNDEKVILVGNEYGYTGTSSPLIAFQEGLKNEKIKRGDYVIFWTVGAGHQFITMLFQY